MKVLVTGVGGQLGYDVMNELSERGYECIGSDILAKEDVALYYTYVQLDITDKDAVEHVVLYEKPDAIIHCAAWTAVDAAEENRIKKKCIRLTWLVLGILLKPAKRLTAKRFILVQIMFLTVKEMSQGNLTIKSMLL